MQEMSLNLFVGKTGAGNVPGLGHSVWWKGGWLFSEDPNKDMWPSWIINFWVLLLWKKGSFSATKKQLEQENCIHRDL